MCKLLAFQTYLIDLIWFIARPKMVHSLGYLRSSPLGGKYKGIRKLEFVAKTAISFQTFEKCITRPQFRVVILVLGHPVEQTIW